MKIIFCAIVTAALSVQAFANSTPKAMFHWSYEEGYTDGNGKKIALSLSAAKSACAKGTHLASAREVIELLQPFGAKIVEVGSANSNSNSMLNLYEFKNSDGTNDSFYVNWNKMKRDSLFGNRYGGDIWTSSGSAKVSSESECVVSLQYAEGQMPGDILCDDDYADELPYICISDNK